MEKDPKILAKIIQNDILKKWEKIENNNKSNNYNTLYLYDLMYIKVILIYSICSALSIESSPRKREDKPRNAIIRYIKKIPDLI